MLTLGSLMTFKNLFYILVLFGALIMLLNMVVAASLKNKVPGGFVGRWLTLMWLFMFFFFLAEAGAFFFIASLHNVLMSYFLIGLVLFFGSVFVAVVNRFIYHLINEFSK